MNASPLEGAPFKTTAFTYATPGEEGTDQYGNPVILPGEPGELVAVFAPFKSDQLQLDAGANPNVIRGRGELVRPIDFPDVVDLGTELACTYAGRRWVATLTVIIPNDLEGEDFGSYFEATLTPGGE